jgi:hypothetical protein
MAPERVLAARRQSHPVQFVDGLPPPALPRMPRRRGLRAIAAYQLRLPLIAFGDLVFERQAWRLVGDVDVDASIVERRTPPLRQTRPVRDPLIKAPTERSRNEVPPLPADPPKLADPSGEDVGQ